MRRFTTFQLGGAVATCSIEGKDATCSIFEDSKLKSETKFAFSKDADIYFKVLNLLRKNTHEDCEM